MSKFVNFTGDIAAPYFIEVVARGSIKPSSQNLVNCVNVFNFRRLTNSPIFDPTDIASVFSTAFEAVYLPLVNPDYKLEQVEVRGMDDPTAATAVEPLNDPGTGAQDMYASDTAIYFQLKTGFRTRNYFGSKHFGGAMESHIDEGYLITAGRTAWGALQTLLLDWTTTGLVDTATNAWKLVVISRDLSNLQASPAVFTGADVAEVLINARVGTMGRRRGQRAAF